MPTSAKKLAYRARLFELLDNSTGILMIGADNVGSKQMQDVRMKLRGQATMLMGKNTTIRKIFNDYLALNENHPVGQLMPYIRGNVGFVFTSSDKIAQVRKVIIESTVPAPCRVGAIAPVDVFVEPGPTGCDPGQTQWFQALNIATKIARGQIEILSRVHIVPVGEKVSPSAASLCEKLNLRPFTYGLSCIVVYDNGTCFDPAVLDLSEDDLVEKFQTGVKAVASLCLALGFPTLASLPHSITNAFKACLSIAMGTDFSFKAGDDWLAEAKAGAAAAAASNAGAAAAAAEEEEESSSSDAGGGAADLFGGSDSDSDSDSSSS